MQDETTCVRQLVVDKLIIMRETIKNTLTLTQENIVFLGITVNAVSQGVINDSLCKASCAS